jgi:hypothetical protein
MGICGIILKRILERDRWGGMDWTDLGQDRDQLRALVNTVMKLLVSQSTGNFLSSCTIAASQEGLSSIKLI